MGNQLPAAVTGFLQQLSYVGLPGGGSSMMSAMLCLPMGAKSAFALVGTSAIKDLANSRRQRRALPHITKLKVCRAGVAAADRAQQGVPRKAESGAGASWCC